MGLMIWNDEMTRITSFFLFVFVLLPKKWFLFLCVTSRNVNFFLWLCWSRWTTWPNKQKWIGNENASVTTEKMQPLSEKFWYDRIKLYTDAPSNPFAFLEYSEQNKTYTVYVSLWTMYKDYCIIFISWCGKGKIILEAVQGECSFTLRVGETQ